MARDPHGNVESQNLSNAELTTLVRQLQEELRETKARVQALENANQPFPGQG